jgi:hypothetical protein
MHTSDGRFSASAEIYEGWRNMAKDFRSYPQEGEVRHYRKDPQPELFARSVPEVGAAAVPRRRGESATF